MHTQHLVGDSPTFERIEKDFYVTPRLLHYASGHEGALVSSQHYDAAADMLTAALLGKEDAARAMAHALITPEAVCMKALLCALSS